MAESFTDTELAALREQERAIPAEGETITVYSHTAEYTDQSHVFDAIDELMASIRAEVECMGPGDFIRVSTKAMTRQEYENLPEGD